MARTSNLAPVSPSNERNPPAPAALQRAGSVLLTSVTSAAPVALLLLLPASSTS